MKAWMLVGFGVVFALVGVVWTLQGIGVLTGSPMTGQGTWLVIGLVLASIGLALVTAGAGALRKRRAG